MLNRLPLYAAVLLASACTTTMYQGPQRPASELAIIEAENSNISHIDGVKTPSGGMTSSQIEVLPGEHSIGVMLRKTTPDDSGVYYSVDPYMLCMRAEAGKRYVVRIELDELSRRWRPRVLERTDTVVNGVIKSRRTRDVTSICSPQLAEEQRQFRDATLFEKACQDGEPLGCNSLGVLYKEGRGVPKDESRAASLYEKACTGGLAQGCFNLGVQYMEGRAISQDARRAAALFEKACTGGVAPGCNNLGVLYKEGHGVPKDESRATELFERACQGGMPSACAGP